MRIRMDLDRGYLPDDYGKYAQPEDCVGHYCVRSFPFTIENVPLGTRALAILLIDWDSVPVCGFPWIHWCCVLDGEFEDTVPIPDDLSRAGARNLIQGYNSTVASGNDEVAVGYVGPNPPDCDHNYTLNVIALDAEVNLAEPFYANELIAEARGHSIAQVGRTFPSRC
jgi:Raf kinase inhibitor-like YbhB/YbcL family protein